MSTLTLSPGASAIFSTTFLSTLVLSLHPAAQALAFTAETSSVKFGPVISPPAASLAFTADQPKITLAVHPGAGSLTFTPQTSGVQTGNVIKAPAAGSLAFSAKTSTLKLAIGPAAGALSLTPDASTITYGIAPAHGTLTTTGQQSRLAFTLRPAATSATFTTESSSLGQAVLIYGSKAVALLRGGQPTIFLGVTKAPAAASLTLATESSTLGQFVLLYPSRAVALLRGGLSSIALGVTKAPAATSMAFATGSSTLSQNLILKPFRAAMLFQAGQPIIQGNAGALAKVLLKGASTSGSTNLPPFTYVSGYGAVLSISFLDDKGIPVDPSTVSLTLTAPWTKATSTPAVVRDSAGNYHADFVPAAGNWTYQWNWTGAAQIGGGNGFMIVRWNPDVLIPQLAVMRFQTGQSRVHITWPYPWFWDFQPPDPTD